MDCPFCNEVGFDKVGLKYHLEHYCEQYQATPDIFHNPCADCKYRKPGTCPYINICLLDDKSECPRQEFFRQ